jgi:hypothetical protein
VAEKDERKRIPRGGAAAGRAKDHIEEREGGKRSNRREGGGLDSGFWDC